VNSFTDDPSASAGSIGEEALIARIRRWVGAAAPSAPAGPGDDCAVVKSRAGAKLLLTADPVIRGQHFEDATPPAAVARKLLRRNLSDIAAMGGRPRFAILSWSIPAHTSLAWLAAFHRALGHDALDFDVTVNGGDIASAGADLAAHLTLVGEAPARPLLRIGAHAGDWIYVTGSLGGSIRGRHTRFEPRLAEGRWLATQKAVRCAIDVSDGIAKELRLIAPRGTRAAIDPRRVPVATAAKRLAETTGRPPLEHALTDGEDFELLFAAAPGAPAGRLEKAWHRRFRTRLTRIGAFVASSDPPVDEVDFTRLSGFEHLRPAPSK
jgi:thiamine-monophosphate kinase